jgi:hypothetical protein
MKSHFIGFHLDFVGFSTSLLCAIHCAALPFLLSLAPLTGLQFLDHPAIETLIIFLSFFIASFALVKGYRRHHQRTLPFLLVSGGFLLLTVGHLLHGTWAETLLVTLGGGSIALAHLVNWKLIRQSATACKPFKKSVKR